MLLRPPSRRSLPYLVAGGWLLLGYANLARGTAHPGVAYRPWAFDHHSYSDLLAMAGDRYFAGGRPLPYLEDSIEYPVLLGLLLWAPSFAPGGPLGYFTVGYAVLAGCALLCVALLSRLPGSRPWWLAGTPALAYYAGLNWDLLPIALLLGAALALERGRAALAGALVALGVSAKLWPIALAPGAAGALLGGRRQRALLAASLAGAAAFAAVNLPVLLLAPRAWGHFWRFNALRGAENSIWEVLRLARGLAPLASDPAFLDAVSALPVAAAALLGASVAWRAAAGSPAAASRVVRLATALVVVAWMGSNKVWSPQYALWAFAAGALAAAPAWLFALHAAVAAVDYHVAFEARASRGLVHLGDPLYTAEEVVRFAAYALLAGWIATALWRSRGASPPAAATAA